MAKQYNQLKIIQHNVRSIHSNEVDLVNYWQKEKPHVILLNSLGLDKADMDKQMSFNGYKTYTTPRSKFNGSAILVKSDLNHQPIKTGHDHLLAIRINTSSGFIALSTYYRCWNSENENEQIPHNLFKKLFNRNYPVYFLGDLNLKHTSFGSAKNNKWGDEFNQKCLQGNSNMKFIGPSFNTYFSGKNKSKIDLIFGNKAGNELHQFIKQGERSGSDHTPIVFTISSKPILIDKPPAYNYKKANWLSYQASLKEYSLPNLNGMNHNELRQEITKICDFVLLTADTNIPKTAKHIYSNVPPKSEITKQLELCICNLDNRIINQILQASEPQKTLMSQLKSDLKNSRKLDASNYHLKIANEISNSLKTPLFFKKLNQMKGNIVAENSTVLNIDDNKIEDPQEVVDGFHTAWKPVFEANPRPTNPESIKIANEYEEWHQNPQSYGEIKPHDIVDLSRLQKPTNEQLKENPTKHMLLAPIEIEDVKDCIKRLKNKKAPGESGISNQMLKKFPDEFIINLVQIFNASLSLGLFPENFKKAITVMIPKPKGDSQNPLNYRPISLLETIGKIYEFIINSRLKWYLEANNLLNDLQFGFRPGRSCHTSIHLMIEFITNAQKKGLPVYMLSKDVEKAFDKVYHPSLIYKIFNKFNLPILFCKTLANFLIDREIKIKHNGKFSEPFTPNAGVPQGSILGPILYLMFINDAPKPKINNKLNCNPDRLDNGKNKFYSEELNIYFADDNVILAAGMKTGQGHFGCKGFRDLVQKSTYWEEGNRIKINANKSVCMAFTPKEPPKNDRTLTLHPVKPRAKINQNDIIKYVTSHKILGITIDRELTFKQHINSLNAIIRKDINKCRRLHECTLETKVFLYKTFFQPKITYAYLIYQNLVSIHQKLAFQTCQNLFIYNFILRDLPYHERPNSLAAHTQLKLKCVAQMSKELSRNFHKRLKLRLPQFYKLFVDYTYTRISKHVGTVIRMTPFKFARESNPTNYYSEAHMTFPDYSVDRLTGSNNG